MNRQTFLGYCIIILDSQFVQYLGQHAGHDAMSRYLKSIQSSHGKIQIQNNPTLFLHHNQPLTTDLELIDNIISHVAPHMPQNPGFPVVSLLA